MATIIEGTQLPGSAPASTPEGATERARLYVPRELQQRLIDDPGAAAWSKEGTAAFVDISGFTALSELLARAGREGAEQIAELIGTRFEAILSVAYEHGGSLLKFGGDSLLLWFERDDHVLRACQAAVLMREALVSAGPVSAGGDSVTLRISQGVHTGQFHFFAVGASHLELLSTGPAWSELVAMERVAEGGEVVVSAAVAAVLPAFARGEPKGAGVLLAADPSPQSGRMPRLPRPPMPADLVARCLSPILRDHVLAGGGTPEHRPVTMAFVKFEGVDRMLAQHGPQSTAAALEQLVSAVETAAAAQQVTFLASDIDADGGKIILTAGAPKATVDDEEHMLLALRTIVDTPLPLPIRIGVHRGAVFAGDIGPAYRRTYTVMGDAVNLTARLMAKAEPGTIYATADVLRRSNTHFETTRIEPFTVKGKAEPVQAWALGRAQSSKARQVSLPRLPLTGRNTELGLIRKAFASARAGSGRLVEVIGEPGVGKTRLLEALRDAAAGFRKQHAACEAYTASTPYAVWHEVLRELMGFGRDDSDTDIAVRLTEAVTARAADLVPWLPLLGLAFGIDLPDTPEVELLAERNRRAKLHEVVEHLLQSLFGERLLIEIENAHHMDLASTELLAYLAARVGSQPWLFAVARRPGDSGFHAAEGETVVRVDVKPLALQDAMRLSQLATEATPLPPHVLEVVAKRSGGNPQFLRDLLRTALDSGGVADLPDSAEAAAIAQIDSLSPEDRAVVRRAAVFGNTFHPRMLAWLADEDGFSAPAADAWSRLQDFFEEESDGYLRFRRTLLRDAAYQGLPYKLRRRLHGTVASHLEEELDAPEEAADTLSLHYLEAGEHPGAWRYARLAAQRAEGAYAYVEAANMYGRALEAARGLSEVAAADVAAVHQAMGDAWFRVAQYRKASDAFVAARKLVAHEPLMDAALMIKLSRLEEKLGNYNEALRWIEQSREALTRSSGPDAARHGARASAWQATVLQAAGRTPEAFEWAERAAREAEAADDAEALGEAYFVQGWARGELGKEGARELMQRSLEAYQRAGNTVRQASILSDLGVICQWQGEWDEALSYYMRSRDAALKIGSSGSAAIARMNAAEIHIDRGEWREAEALLMETLPFWKASEYHYFLAGCLTFLGRVSQGLGRIDEAIARLEEAKAQFLMVGAEPEVPAIEARIAECRLAKGDADGALAVVTGLLQRASESNGIVKVQPLLERIQGHALMQQGDLWSARDALDASLASARERNNRFEATLSMLSLIELDRREGVEPPHEMLTESRETLAAFKVRAVPPVPAAAA